MAAAKWTRAETMLGGSVPRAHDRSCRAIARSTTDWRARSAGNWPCRRPQGHAEIARVGGVTAASQACGGRTGDVEPAIGAQLSAAAFLVLPARAAWAGGIAPRFGLGCDGWWIVLVVTEVFKGLLDCTL
jgi:hypothetical protein